MLLPNNHNPLSSSSFIQVYSSGNPLNLQEAINLLGVVSDFDFKASEKTPRFSIFDSQKEGHTLWVENDTLNEEYRKYLEGIVKSRNLKIREQKKYLVISDW